MPRMLQDIVQYFGRICSSQRTDILPLAVGTKISTVANDGVGSILAVHRDSTGIYALALEPNRPHSSLSLLYNCSLSEGYLT